LGAALDAGGGLGASSQAADMTASAATSETLEAPVRKVPMMRPHPTRSTPLAASDRATPQQLFAAVAGRTFVE
jgi:hypothetical protein